MNKRNEIEQLIFICSKLPGLGPRSARRLVLHLVKDKETRINILLKSLQEVYNKINNCNMCGNIDTQNPCNICTDPSRENQYLAIVETVADLWAIERSKTYRGKYFVLGSSLGVGNSEKNTVILAKLKKLISSEEFKEIIIATNATLEGQSTAFLITDYIQDLNLKISRLGSGMPMGAELDYLDEGTLSAALASRQIFEI